MKENGKKMINLLEEIGNAASIGITGHIRPDGDCTAAVLAAYQYLRKAKPDASVRIFLEDIPTIYGGISGADRLESGEGADGQFDVFLVLDCSVDRTGPIEKLVRTADKIINIDHHVSNSNGSGHVNHVVPSASSVCEVLYELLDKQYVDRQIAEAIYIGIINDCGVFQYSNTSRRTMEIAGELIEYGFPFADLIQKTFYEKTYVQNQLMGRALLESILFMDGRCIVSCIDRKTMEFYGAKPKHLDGIVSQLRNTRGVDCAIFMYEVGCMEYKVSLRSNTKLNVARVAEQFGGGGHVRAAGCTMNGTFHDVVNNLSAVIEELLEA